VTAVFTARFQGQFVVHRLGLPMIYVHTKFDVSMFTHYEEKATQNVEIAVVWSAYYVLFDFNRNYESILYRSHVIGSYLSKVTYFNLPYLHLAPPLGMAPLNLQDFWHQSPCDIVRRCLRNSMFSRFDTITACDIQTGRQTDRHTTTANTSQA